jgi:hypothetical protein
VLKDDDTLSADPLQDFVKQLAVAATTGALPGIWAKLKQWLVRRRPASPVLAQFEHDPAGHASELVQILHELHFGEDPEGRSILREGLSMHAVSQTASGNLVIQAGRDIGAIHTTVPAAGPTRVRIGVDAWNLLQRQHEAADEKYVCVPEERAAMARVEGWQEITLPGPGQTIDRLIVVDGSQTIGVPMHRPLPWKDLSLTARRMLGRVVRGNGSLDHFQAADLDVIRVHYSGRMYGFGYRNMAGALALSELVQPNRQFFTQRGVLYFLTDEGRRVGETLLRAYGDAWLNRPNPDCQEGWIS